MYVGGFHDILCLRYREQDRIAQFKIECVIFGQNQHRQH